MARIEIPWYKSTVRKGQYGGIDPVVVDIPDFQTPRPRPRTQRPRGRNPVPIPETVPVTATVPSTQPSTIPVTNPVTSPIGGTIGVGVGVELPNGLGVPYGGQIPSPIPIPGYSEPKPTGNPLPTGNGLVSAIEQGARNVSPNANSYANSKYVTLEQQNYLDAMQNFALPEQKHIIFQIWDVVDLALTLALLVPAVNAVAAPLRGASAVLRFITNLKNIKTFASFMWNITKQFGKSAGDALQKVVNKTNYQQFIKAVKEYDFLPDYLAKGAF